MAIFVLYKYKGDAYNERYSVTQTDVKWLELPQPNGVESVVEREVYIRGHG
jgi:hypothetical protein